MDPKRYPNRLSVTHYGNALGSAAERHPATAQVTALLSDRWAGMQIWSLCMLTHADVGASPDAVC